MTTAKASQDNYTRVSLQSVTKTGKPIFAYLRRSTKKEEQRDSKQKQNDSIDLMAQDIGISIEDIQIFEDDFTGFKITTKNGKPQTKRKGYIALMEAIDKCKVPCILLAYDYSRLARNIPDGLTICEKLGLYGNKQKIEYIRFYDGTKWDKTTRDKTINDAFSEANGYSEALSKQKQDKNITSLRRGIMPKTIKAPHGLQCTERGIEETDTMQYIYRAFEMKVEGTLGKDISKYLALHGVRITEGNLSFMLFNKTQYIGEYTHPKTGDIFDKLIFTSGKTAIPRHLWDKVQLRLGKKVGGYGERQKGDIIGGLLRWEDDKTKSFSLDIKTKPNGKQHKFYKNNSFGGVNIGEKKILEKFLSEAIPRIVFVWYKTYLLKHMHERQKAFKEMKGGILANMREVHPDFVEQYTTLIGQVIDNDETSLNISQTFEELIAEGHTTEDKIIKFLRKDNRDYIALFKEIQDTIKTGDTVANEEILKLLCDFCDSDAKKISFEIFKDSISNSPALTRNIIEKESKTDTKKQLETKLQVLEEEKKTIRKNGIKGGYTAEETNEATKDTEKEIQSIESQIEELGESTDMEQFIERLPEVLNKTFELASKVLSNADIEAMRSDIEQLLEICTFELTINNKKELKIKLFEGLEVGKISVVGDIGFEPMTPCV